MFIQTEATPNPATLKFLPGREVMGDRGTADFASAETAARSPLAAYRAFARSLRDVAAALREDPEFADVHGVVAVTLFHEPLAQQGFQVLPLPPLRARLYSLGFRLMRRVYGTAVPASEPEPRLAWMRRAAFLARHG